MVYVRLCDCYENIKIKLWSRISISGSILESKSIFAVFQKKGQKRAKYLKLWAKMYKT